MVSHARSLDTQLVIYLHNQIQQIVCIYYYKYNFHTHITFHLVLATVGDYEHHRDIEYKIENVPCSCVELFEHTVIAMKKAAHRFLCQPVVKCIPIPVLDIIILCT